MARPLLLLLLLPLLLACAPEPVPESSARQTAAPSGTPAPQAQASAEVSPKVSQESGGFGQRHDLEGADAQAILTAIASDILREEGEKRALAEHYLTRGRQAFAEQRYPEAQAELERAVALDPKNDDAIALLQRASVLTGDRPKYGAVLDSLAQERSAAVDERRQRVAKWFDEGERFMASRDYRAAEERFERVLEAMRWSEVPLDPGTLEQRARMLLVRAQVLGEEAKLDHRARLEAEASEAAERERRR